MDNTTLDQLRDLLQRRVYALEVEFGVYEMEAGDQSKSALERDESRTVVASISGGITEMFMLAVHLDLKPPLQLKALPIPEFDEEDLPFYPSSAICEEVARSIRKHGD